MLYPQIDSTPDNEKGCWDYYGFSSPTGNKLAYATKHGVLNKAMIQILTNLTAGTLPLTNVNISGPV